MAANDEVHHYGERSVSRRVETILPLRLGTGEVVLSSIEIITILQLMSLETAKGS